MTNKHTTEELTGMIREFFDAFKATDNDGCKIFRINHRLDGSDPAVVSLNCAMNNLWSVIAPDSPTTTEVKFSDLADHLHHISENFEGDTCYALSKEISANLGQAVIAMERENMAEEDTDIPDLKEALRTLDDIEVAVGHGDWRTLKTGSVIRILRRKAEQSEASAKAIDAANEEERQKIISDAIERGRQLDGGNAKALAAAIWKSQSESVLRVMWEGYPDFFWTRIFRPLTAEEVIEIRNSESILIELDPSNSLLGESRD